MRPGREGPEAELHLRDRVGHDGALIGPWTPWLRWPQYGGPIWDLVKALTLSPALPRELRELAILVAGAKFHAAYQTFNTARSVFGSVPTTLASRTRPSSIVTVTAFEFCTT